jgi:hypothetical protein
LAQRNKKAAVPFTWHLRLVATSCAKERAAGFGEYAQGRDVGSLADSAASGHKSQVRSILLRAGNIYKQYPPIRRDSSPAQQANSTWSERNVYRTMKNGRPKPFHAIATRL